MPPINQNPIHVDMTNPSMVQPTPVVTPPTAPVSPTTGSTSAPTTGTTPTPTTSTTPTDTITSPTSADQNTINTNTINTAKTAQDTLNKQMDDAYTSFKNTSDQYLNGSIPLNSGEQAQVNGLTQQYQSLIDQQKLANISATGTANIRGYQTGAAEYDPTFQAKTIGTIFTAGQQKIANLTTQMASAVANLTQSFQDNDFNKIKSAYDEYKDYETKRSDALQKTIDDTQKAIKDAHDQFYNEVTKPIQDIATEVAKTGDAKTAAAVGAATTVSEAIAAAGNSLQNATGQLGDYLQYKRDATASGLVPQDYSTWKKADDAQTAKEKISEAYGTAFATASGKAAAESKNQGSVATSPVVSPLGITYNPPASIAPYVSFASNGVKYVDMSSFKGTPTEANAAIQDAQAAGYKVLTNKNTALDIQNITDANAKLDNMQKAFAGITQDSAKDRALYGAALTTMAKKFQTDPNVVASDIYQDAALDILKAMSGVQGFRGGASIVQQVKDTFPTATDTTASANAKIATIKSLIGDRENALVGTPSATDQTLITQKTNENNLTQNINNFKTSNPKVYSGASAMFTSVDPSTGQPYTAEDILQAFPELNQ